jgi:inosose dehydratase
MRIGLAGAGRIGSMHAGVLAAMEPVETVVVADVDPARSAAVADVVGGEACACVESLFDSCVDALVVASSTDSHAGLVMAAVAAGLPVFCEKPVAADIESTLKVIAAIEDSDVPVQVGFQRRFDAGYLAARERVARGDLGFVHTLRSCTLDPAPPPAVHAFVDACHASGAEVLVLAAATGAAGYDDRPVLDSPGWSTLLANLDAIDEATSARGVVTALHPHVGTLVERVDDVDRVLTGSGVGLCLDTGHLLAGGTDPVRLARSHPQRVVHVHLKDVDTRLAEKVRAGALSYTDAIPKGLFIPLGSGDLDIAGLVGALRDEGYAGWFVLEQDVMLDGEPSGEGPVADVRTCLGHLREVTR